MFVLGAGALGVRLRPRWLQGPDAPERTHLAVCADGERVLSRTLHRSRISSGTCTPRKSSTQHRSPLSIGQELCKEFKLCFSKNGIKTPISPSPPAAQGWETGLGSGQGRGTESFTGQVGFPVEEAERPDVVLTRFLTAGGEECWLQLEAGRSAGAVVGAAGGGCGDVLGDCGGTLGGDWGAGGELGHGTCRSRQNSS